MRAKLEWQGDHAKRGGGGSPTRSASGSPLPPPAAAPSPASGRRAPTARSLSDTRPDIVSPIRTIPYPRFRGRELTPLTPVLPPSPHRSEIMTSGWCGEVGVEPKSLGSEDRRVSAGTWIETGVTPAAGRGIAPAPKRGSPPAMAGPSAAGARRSACWPVSASCPKIRLRWRGSGLKKTRTTRSGDGASPRRFTAAVTNPKPPGCRAPALVRPLQSKRRTRRSASLERRLARSC